jgi:hypothetical protein
MKRQKEKQANEYLRDNFFSRIQVLSDSVETCGFADDKIDFLLNYLQKHIDDLVHSYIEKVVYEVNQ